MRSGIEYSQSRPQRPRGAFHVERAQRGQEWRLPSPRSSLQFLLSSREEQESGFLHQVWGLAQWPLEDRGGSSWAMTVLGTPILQEAVRAWGSLSSPPSALVVLSGVDELGQGGSVGAACNKPTCLLPISLWPLCFPICPHEYSTDLLSWRLLSSVLWHELLWADAAVQLTLRDSPLSRLGIPGMTNYSECFWDGLAAFSGVGTISGMWCQVLENLTDFQPFCFNMVVSMSGTVCSMLNS